jgi:hypothetical protein
VDRLKACPPDVWRVKKFLGRLGFLRKQDLSLIEPKIVETEKILNGLIRALRDD